MDWTHFEQLRVSGFTMTRRGYDKREVDRFLDTLAEWLETDAANELGDQAVQRKLELVGKSTAHILLTTEKESQELRRTTQAECDDLRQKADAAAKDTRRQAEDYSSTARAKADEYSSTTRAKADEYSANLRTKTEEEARRAKEAATEAARKTVEEGDRRRAAAEAVVAELKTQRDDTVAEMERLRSELLSTISKHTTRSAPEPRAGDGRRKRANIAKQMETATEKIETKENLEPAEA
jgi:DivIVA domain-containing protein